LKHLLLAVQEICWPFSRELATWDCKLSSIPVGNPRCDKERLRDETSR